MVLVTYSLIASVFMEHKAIAFSFCSLFDSSETDLVLRRLLSSFVVGGGLASDWELCEKVQGGEGREGEREERWSVGRSGLRVCLLCL